MPASIPSLLEEAYTHRKSNNIPQAKRLLNQVLAINPTEEAALTMCGHIEYKYKNYDSALNYYQNAIQASSSPISDLYLFLGNTYRQLGLCPEAIDAYQKALLISPESIAPKIRIAHIHYYQHQFHTAIPLYEEILTQVPSHHEAKTFLRKTKLARITYKLISLFKKYTSILLLFKKHNKDLFTIIIQGPLNETSLKNIPQYLKFANVIVSHWDSDPPALKTLIPPNVLSISQPFPPPELHSVINPGSLFFIAKTMIPALKKTSTPFAIKVRSDESFSNLKFFCHKITLYPTRWTTTNIWFRKDSHYKYHPCDHIIGTTTQHLLNTYQLVQKICHNPTHYQFYSIKNNLLYLPSNNHYPFVVVCESITAIAFLLQKNIEPSFSSSKQLMKENFNIVPLPLFIKFLWASGSFQLKNQSNPFPKESILSLHQL